MAEIIKEEVVSEEVVSEEVEGEGIADLEEVEGDEVEGEEEIIKDVVDKKETTRKCKGFFSLYPVEDFTQSEDYSDAYLKSKNLFKEEED